jgi:hypothetical protein
MVQARVQASGTAISDRDALLAALTYLQQN